MKKYLTKAILILSIFYPASVFALEDFSKLGQFINDIKTNVIVNLSALFLTTAVVAFFYGVINYIIAIRSGDIDGTKSGRNFMLWGLIALFVMFSVWGIVTFAQKTLGIDGVTTIKIPSIIFDTGTAPTSPESPLGNTNPYSPVGSANASNPSPLNSLFGVIAPTGGQIGSIVDGLECINNPDCQSGNCVLSTKTGVKRCQASTAQSGVGSQNASLPSAASVNNNQSSNVSFSTQDVINCGLGGGSISTTGSCVEPATPEIGYYTCMNSLGNDVNNAWKCEAVYKNFGGTLKPIGTTVFNKSECISGQEAGGKCI